MRQLSALAASAKLLGAGVTMADEVGLANLRLGAMALQVASAPNEACSISRRGRSPRRPSGEQRDGRGPISVFA